MVSSFVISLGLTVSILYSCHGWNIDTRNPVIISDLFDGSDSFFGASVALLGDGGDKSNSPASSASSWVIVGAPKANSTHPKHKNIFEPGVTWRCSLGLNPEDFCEVLLMDPTENKYFQKDESPGFDRKDEGWLGGTIYSSNNGDQSRFVSCANRWQNQWLAVSSNLTQHYMMNGICYWRPTSHLRTEDPVPDLPHNYRILPLMNPKLQAIESEFMWVFGQSGFSLHITNDNQMILGAPGLNAWKGGVIHLADKKPASLRRNGSPDEYGGVFENIRVSSSQLNNELNHNNSYFGYAVTSGNFIRASDTSKTQFVAGAPRGNNLQGKVVVFTFPTRGSVLNIMQEINGTKIGSYFGSVLCSVDINNDGLIDLLVGAPQYSTKLNPKFSAFRAAEPSPTVESIGQFGALVKPAEFGDEGRVFVYISSGTELVKQTELNGGNAFASRFGTSISSIGDINNDGLNDVAIGAPYENDGRGAVYIYLGNSDGLRNQYAQVIYAEELSPIIYGFGYSLSHGVDIDGNGYNDLAVGSLISAQTVILRTRPVVTLSRKITTTLEKLPLNSTQFQFQACVSFTGKHAPVKIDISMKLTMDIDSKPPRVYVRLGENNSAVERIYTFKSVPYGRSSCETMTGIIRQPLAVSGNSITIKTELSLIQEVKKVEASFYNLMATQAPNRIPKLVKSGPKYEAFCSDCPIQDSESSKKASFFSLPLELPCGSDNKCVSDIRLSSKFLDINPEKGFVMGSEPTLTLQISMENLGEAALSPSLKISWKKLNLQNVPSNCEPLGGSGGIAAGAISDYLCKFGEMLAENSTVDLTLVFDAKDLYASGKNDAFECIVTARTTSEMSKPAQLNLELPLVFEGDIFMTAKEIVVPLSSESLNPYQYFTHSFEVGLSGYSSLEFVGVNFSVPVNLIGATDEPIIEITNFQRNMDGKLIDCIRMKHAVKIPALPNEEEDEEEMKIKLEVNAESELVQIPDAPTLSESERNLRRRREVEDLQDGKNPGGTSSVGKKVAKNGIFTIDCSTDYVTCETFTCKLNKFKSNSQANFDFTMRISSENLQKLLKEEKAVSLHVKSKGKVEISSPPSYVPPSGHQPDEAEAITKFELDSAKVAQWVYMASFGGGIIGLICLIFCFYACGCFERKKKPGEEEEVVENREVSEQSKPLQSQTIPEEDENESSFSREETASPEDRPNHYYFSR